jgi:AcrR family transcriptional regulator
MTVREVCDALGVSRAMVQKLEAGGELRRLRATGRVVFDRARVEQLREARDVTKEQRRQEREELALRGEAAEDQHQQVEFAAWAKSAAEKRELETIHQELAQLSADLNELREEQRRQAWASRMEALTRRNERPTVERDSEPSVATIGLLSLGAMALIVHAGREKNETAASVRGGGQSRAGSR